MIEMRKITKNLKIDINSLDIKAQKKSYFIINAKYIIFFF